MEHVEIERRFLVRRMPCDLSQYKKRIIEQGYLNIDPVVRIRRDNDSYYLTYKNGHSSVREEYNLPLTEQGYAHLLAKADGSIISKDRYEIPDQGLTIELDIFHGVLEGICWAEVEFPSPEAENAYVPPEWFGTEITETYSNSQLSQMTEKQARDFVKKINSLTSAS